MSAITNEAAVHSPWPYLPKSGPVMMIPPQSFIEGGLILNDLFPGESIPCFSSFLTVSRSSSSITAQLKDFVLGEFKLCGVDVFVDCTHGEVDDSLTTVIYNYTVTAANTGFGDVYNATVFYGGQEIGFFEVFSPSQVEEISGTFESLEESPQTNTASIVAYAVQNPLSEDDVLEDTTVEDTCPLVPIVTSLQSTVGCTNMVIDEDTEEYVYTYSVTVENTGFGVLTLSEAVLTHDAGTTVLDSLVDNNLNPFGLGKKTGTIRTTVPLTSLQFDVTAYDYANQLVDDTSNSNTCPIVKIDPSITVTKLCNSSLVGENDRVVVQISVEGQVCNNGDIRLNNVELTDDMGTVDTNDDYSASYATLAQGACEQYSHTFYPSVPALSFSDTVAVTGDVILNLGQVDDSVTATCGLCPP